MEGNITLEVKEAEEEVEGKEEKSEDSHPVKVDMLGEYVAEMHASNNHGFVAQFQVCTMQQVAVLWHSFRQPAALWHSFRYAPCNLQLCGTVSGMHHATGSSFVARFNTQQLHCTTWNTSLAMTPPLCPRLSQLER